MTIQTTILDKIAIVDIDIRVWSGAKALTAADFVNVNENDLPSTRVASFGRKHLISKDALRPFSSLRNKASDLCTRVGTRILGGYAIPQDSIDPLGEQLEVLCQEFDAEVGAFMADYDMMVADWIATNPDMAEPLKRAILPRSVVRSRFHAAFTIFEVNASPRDRTNSLAKVGGDLLDSILAQVVVSFKTHIESKRGAPGDSYRKEVRQTVSDMAAKLARFSFVDPSGGMKVLANRLSAAVAGQGRIADSEFTALWALISPLTSIEAIKTVLAGYAGSLPQAVSAQPAPVLAPPAELHLFLPALADGSPSSPPESIIPDDGAAGDGKTAHATDAYPVDAFSLAEFGPAPGGDTADTSSIRSAPSWDVNLAW